MESDEINLPHNNDGNDYDGDGGYAGAEADGMQEVVLYILDVDPEGKVGGEPACAKAGPERQGFFGGTDCPSALRTLD
mgnify:FL=1